MATLWSRKATMVAGACLIAFAGMSVPARAQSSTPPADEKAKAEEKAKAAEKPASEVKEEITVTATLREEAIQEVPFAVEAPTQEVLQARGVDSIEGVAANVPGFIVQNLGPGQSQVAIRGVSSGQIVRDQPGVKEQVGVYLDDSVISLSLFTPDVDLFDVTRVEVLKGPQGTLFGAGSESGTVRYITNQPELGVSSSTGEFGISSIDGGEIGGVAKVSLNQPLGDTSAMRLAVYYNDIGGYIDAVQPDLSIDKDVNGGRRAGVRWAFKMQPNEHLTLTPRILYQDVKTDGMNRVDLFNILANPYTTTRPAVTLGDRQQFTQIGEPFTDKFTLADFNLDYKFDGGMDLTSITSYTKRDILQVRDATALTASITGGTIGLPESVYTIDAPLDDKTKATVWTQELRLSGQTDSFNWLGGAFYSKIKRDYGQSLFVDGFEDATGIPTAGHFGAGKDILFFSKLHYDFKQYAVFGEGTWKIGERFDLTAGARYYNYKESRTQVFDGIFADPASRPGSVDANGVVPRVIASFKFADSTSLNAQVSKGFRLGGVNDNLNVPLCTAADLAAYSGHDTWKNETAMNYEVGTKSTLSGGGTFNISAFYTNIKDLQATVTAGSCSSRIILNVPTARAQGFEFALTKELSSHFDIDLSASYTDSKLTSTVRDTSGNVLAGIESGNRLPTVPKLQASAAATYQWQVGGSWLGSVNASYQHVGARFTQIGDQAAGFGTVNLLTFRGTIGGPLTQGTFTFDPELPAYDIANLRIGFANQKWDVSLFVNNLTDEQARLALDQERGTRARVGFLTNTPRTYGVNARINFK
jgi:iron complex outermembrane receptor protein